MSVYPKALGYIGLKKKQLSMPSHVPGARSQVPGGPRSQEVPGPPTMSHGFWPCPGAYSPADQNPDCQLYCCSHDIGEKINMIIGYVYPMVKLA